MKRSVFVIEDDLKFMSEIKEALAQINPDIEVREFVDLSAFVGWLQGTVDRLKGKKTPPPIDAATTEAAPVSDPNNAPPADPAVAPVESAQVEATAPADSANPATPTEPATPPPSDEIEIGLLICKSEFLKQKGFSLLKKTQEYFILHRLCTKEVPTNFVLTAFDVENFDFSRYENQIVSNILFKPFDKLILREHLRTALAGGKPDTSGEIYKQKTKSKVEMLKDVTLDSISEVGFTTTSDREIVVGAQAKYYSDLFQAGKLSSVHARATICAPLADKPGFFNCEFSYINVQNAQISAIRKVVKSNKSHETKVIKASKELPKYIYNFVVLSPHGLPSVKTNLEKAFKNIKFTEYEEYISFTMDIDPKSLSNDKSKDKFLPFPAAGKIFCDLKINKIVAMEPPPAETATVFGVPLKKAMETDGFIHNRVHNDDRNKWVALCKSQLKAGSPPVILKFKGSDDKMAFIKVSHLHQVKHEKLGEVISIEMAECTEQEKLTYLQALSRLPAVVDALFVDALFLGESYVDRWQMVTSIINEKNKKANAPPVKLIFLTDRPLDSDDMLAKQAPIDNVFNRPLDNAYFIKKTRVAFEKLILLEEDLEFSSVINQAHIKVAQPVISEEVAETGLSIQYHRPIAVGSFRKICLWLPHEVGLPEFLASCNAVEEVEIEVDKKKRKSFICHFIFFGVRDTSLKHIRRWIKDYYVSTKEQEGG